MYEFHVSAGGRDYRIRELDANVVDTQSWSETHVSGTSYGGGGTLQGGSGYIAAPTLSVSSSTTAYTKFFVIDENSREWSFQAPSDFSARNGQTLRTKWIAEKDKKPALVALIT